eukprot:TRINITY_DN102410_c0_g1_i1.p1 TRINITY_DN102410_c0_g1~~TRINITY_DN102410_c0_g1_i1.p1  ORF type:complete len:1071 (-),score=164.59 TRINITY_DN102410_c0_g1_i1:35-2935(-)
MFVEGYKGLQSDRAIDTMWLLFSSWSATFTLIGLWLALRFQMKIAGSARERLLRRHRFMVPDDLVVGKMGGSNLVSQVAGFHDWVLHSMEELVSVQTDMETAAEKNAPLYIRSQKTSEAGPPPLRLRVEGIGRTRVDAEPLRKGMHAWLHESGEGYAQTTTLDVPYFLLGETLVRMPWQFDPDLPSMRLRVYGEATLYVTQQPAGGASIGKKTPLGTTPSTAGPAGGAATSVGIRKAFWLEGTVPSWPPDELPLVTTGFHPKWRGESGYGEFRRVEGFSIFVDTQETMELPLYKIVLAKPAEGMDYVDVHIQWNFIGPGKALTMVLRKAHVHCKEEDFPLAEFNNEVKQLMPLRRFAGQYLAEGISCLLAATISLFVAKRYQQRLPSWWFEILIVLIALLPAVVVVQLMPVETTKAGEMARVVANLSAINDQEAHQSAYQWIKGAMMRRRSWSKDMDLELPYRQSPDQQATTLEDDNFSETAYDEEHGSDLARRLAAVERVPSSQSRDLAAEVRSSSSAQQGAVAATPSFSPLSFSVCGSPESAAPCREVIKSCSEKIGTAVDTCRVEVPNRSSSRMDMRNRKLEKMRGSGSQILPDEPSEGPKIAPAGWKEQLRDALADLYHGVDREKTLKLWTGLLHVVFSLSLLSVVAVRILLGTETASGATGYGTGAPSEPAGAADLRWTTWETEWPPFFQPTAVAFHSGQLYAASGGLLQKFAPSPAPASGTLQAVGPPTFLPGSVRGLGVVGEHVVALSDKGVFDLSELDPSWTSATSVPAQAGPLSILSSQAALDRDPLVQLPSQFGGNQLSAAAVSMASNSQGSTARLSSTAFVLAANGGELQLCRVPAQANASRGPPAVMDVLAKLTPEDKESRPREVRGLHLCQTGCAGEAVLWTADDDSVVWAIGMESSQVRARFQTRPEHGRRIVALTGNSTHLVAALTLAGQPAVFVAAPYPALPEVVSPLEL